MRLLRNSWFLLLLLSIQSVGQQKVLKGYLGVEGGESFVYKLVFTDSAGYIKGHAYTWLYEQSEVQAAITGHIDKVNKTLSFTETMILYNKGFQSNTTICLINAVLKYKKEGNDRVFTGSITSSDVTNVSCGRGTVTFQDNEVLRSIFDDQPAGVDPPKPKEVIAKSQKPIKIVYDTASTAPVKAKTPAVAYDAGPVRITQGVEKAYEWTTDTIIVDFWDGGRIDGDIITVFFNGSPVLERYSLVKQPKRIKLSLSAANTESITIVADNEGNEALSTTNILLTDGKVQYPIEAYNAVGKQAVIRIRRAR